MTIIRFFKTCCWIGITFLTFVSCIVDEKEDSLPNILWITTEDMSLELGCYGDLIAKTPNIDEFASKSLLYTNAFATAPVCAPARSTIITGMHQSSIGSHHMRTTGRLPSTMKYFPEVLRAAGYYCTNNSKEDYNLVYQSAMIWDDSSDSAHWRNRKKSDQPFFSVFNYIGTHESCVNNERKHLSFTGNLKADQFVDPADVVLPVYFPDTENTRKLWARYYSNISALDDYFADILDQLEEDGLAENTIVFFYSDHGAGVPIHKRWLFDTGLKIPLIIHIPEKYNYLSQSKMGTTVDELVSFVDLAPTTLKVAGLEVPDYMQGRAFLGKEASPEREFIYAARDRMDERYDMQRAVRSKHFKYIRYYEPSKPYLQFMNTPEKGGIMKEIRKAFNEGDLPDAGKRIMATAKPKEELFSLKDDPDELNNLAADPAYNEVLIRLRKAHESWGVRIQDAGLIPEPILRSLEAKYNKSIYDVLRTESISIEEIQQVALSEDNDELTAGLENENEAVRYWAAINIGDHYQWKNELLLERLSNGLNDENHLVRIASARALIKMGHLESSLQVLENELQNSNEWIRLNAALVLDESGEVARSSINSLRLAMEDQNKYVTRVANHALNNLLGTQNVVR